MSRTLPDSVQLAFPPEWTDVPLDEPGVRAFLTEHVEPLKDSVGVGMARQLELAYTRIALLAKGQNVILASSYLALDERPDAEDVPILAGVTVSALGREQIGTEVPLHEDVLLTAFASADDPGSTFDEIEPPGKTSVGGLNAVKLLRLATMSEAELGTVRQFAQTYLVPVAEGDGVIVVNFSTINFEYAKQFSELFEKIAGTLRILYPNDPTFEPVEPSDAETNSDGAGSLA